MQISRRSFLKSAAGSAVGVPFILPSRIWAAETKPNSMQENLPRTHGQVIGENTVIRIKPHHFVDIITSFGDGKVELAPHPYGHALHTVTARILHNPDVLLEMELGADDICAPCKHNIAGRCDDTIDTSYRPTAPSSKREWNLLIDQRWCARLKIKQGDRLTARQFCERLRQLAGDITDIYREIPADKTADRARKLRAGITKFLL